MPTLTPTLREEIRGSGSTYNSDGSSTTSATAQTHRAKPKSAPAAPQIPAAHTANGDAVGHLHERNEPANAYMEEVGQHIYIQNVHLTRNDKHNSFGLKLFSLAEKTRGSNVGCGVQKILTNASTPPGLVQEGDVVVSVNGQDSSNWTYERTVEEIRSVTGRTLILSLRRDKPKTVKRKRSTSSSSVGSKNQAAPTDKAKGDPRTAAVPSRRSSTAEDTKTASTTLAKPVAVPPCDVANASDTAQTRSQAISKDESSKSKESPASEEEGIEPHVKEKIEYKDEAKAAKKKRRKKMENNNKEKGEEDKEPSEQNDGSNSPDPVFDDYSAPPNGPVESQFINAIKEQASNNMNPTPLDEDGPKLRFVFISIPTDEGSVLAEIILNDMKVGSIRAEYIKKEANFCEKCERIGGDLELVAGELFEEGGKIRCGDLKSFDCCWQKSDDSYFLYFRQIDVQEEFESNEKRSDVISTLINLFLADERMKKWKIVAYRANADPQLRQQLFAAEPHDSILPFSVENQEVYAENSWIASEKERRHNIAFESRPFVRAGFKELSKESTEEMGFLYLTKEMFSRSGKNVMSYAKAEQIQLRCDDPPKIEEYRKEKLEFELQATILEEDSQLKMENHKLNFQTPFQRSKLSQYDESSFVERVLPKIDQLIAKGADVGESKALHAAAFQHFVGLFGPLIDRGAKINSRDKNSMTPLMILGSNVAKRTENDIIRSQLAISILVALGADKNVRDRAGRTALGHYYGTMKDLNKLESLQLGVPETPIDKTLERLLMPAEGPTAADQRARDGA